MNRKLLLGITLGAIPMILASLILVWLSDARASAGTSGSATAPGLISYQGYLSDEAGEPINGNLNLTFKLYAAASGGEPLWQETHPSVTAVDGYFGVLLGSVNPLDASDFASDARFLEIIVQTGEGPVVMPRQRLAAVPYALQAERAQAASSADEATYAESAGHAPWAGLSGVPAGFADGVDDGDHYRNVIVVAKNGGDYSSVQAALDSITDASAANPYLVWVAPGTYSEQVTLKPHVHLQGAGQEATVLTSAASGTATDLVATLVLASHTSLRDLSVHNTGSGTRDIALLAPRGTLTATVMRVTARARGTANSGTGIYVLGDTPGGAATAVALTDVTATGENASESNLGLQIKDARVTLHAGSFVGRGGTLAYAISNEAGGVLEAHAVTALGQLAQDRSYGLANSGTAQLWGGSFTGRGGDLFAYGIQNRASLDSQGVTAFGENAYSNFGLDNYQNSARLNGGFFTARGGTNSTAIRNGTQAILLEAQGVTALAQDASGSNAAVDNSGDRAWLVGGSYTAEGGDQADAVAVGATDGVLVADNVSALARAGLHNHALDNSGIDTVVRLDGGSFVAQGGSTAVGIYDAAIGSDCSFTGDNLRVWGREATSNNHAIVTSGVISITGSHLTGAPAVQATSSGYVFLGTSQLEGGFDEDDMVACANSHDGEGHPLDNTCKMESEDGMAKAAVAVYCADENAFWRRFFNREADDILVNDGLAVGVCTINFKFDVSTRYWTASPVGPSDRGVTCETISSTTLQCFHFGAGGTGANGDIMVVIY